MKRGRKKKTCCDNIENYIVGFGVNGYRNWTYKYCKVCGKTLKNSVEFYKPL